MPLFRTTVFRLSLIYACLYSLLSAAGLGYTYWSTAAHSMAQVDARLSLEADVLLELYRTRALPELTEAIRRRNRDDGQRKIFFICCTDRIAQPVPIASTPGRRMRALLLQPYVSGTCLQFRAIRAMPMIRCGC
ncbi:MAG: hypothetical protein HC808_04055 [Candidatus Competibacteraceae bacterium]|nr:hypothetical protein [Candidatus Competibacteraceae bacterium]